MNAQEIAERQGLTILSKEGEQYLCARETSDGGWFLVIYHIFAGELFRTFDTGQVYTREEINRIPHVADLLAVCKVMSETLAHLLRNDPHLAENVVIPPQLEAAQAAIAGARGIDETMRSV